MKIVRFIFFFLILLVLFRFVFVVKKINCLIEDAFLESGVCERINDHFKNKSLFFTDFENDPIWDELLVEQQYGQIYQYQKISKSLFGAINLSLLAKSPDYRLIFNQNRYILNQNNKLKNDQARLDLPSIEFMGDTTLLEEHGYLNETYHQKFISLSQAMHQYQINSQRIIWQSDQEIHIFLEEIEVILDDEKDFVYQMERLALILQQNKSENIFVEKKILDMRFNLPVLRE